MGAIEVRALTADRWDDVFAVFGERGAYANCWCAWWRLSARAFDEATPAERRALFEDLVRSGREPGVLAYVDGRPVGWCAVAPRTEYPRLQRSPHTKPVDDAPAWAITCFYIDRAHRGAGVASALLDGAVRFAFDRGADIVEGIPYDPATKATDAASSYTGVLPMFERAGFDVVARRSPTGRVVVRRTRTARPAG